MGRADPFVVAAADGRRSEGGLPVRRARAHGPAASAEPGAVDAAGAAALLPDSSPERVDALAAAAAQHAGGGAFGPAPGGERALSGLAAFDPGRRGVRSLAVVAALVVLVAAALAWRARPHVEPVSAAAAPTVAGRVDTTPGPATVTTSAAGRSGGSDIVVAVGGKVRKPGLVRLTPGARVADALQAAGGADPGVDVALLNLARKVVDGELIMVGVTAPPGLAAAPGTAPPGAPPGPVNLNTATLADLDSLPGVGPVLAQRILDARQAHGGFTAVSDLRRVDGIGEARYEQLKDLVTV
ncbi:helix-hairpin-helix domain-containing protein [Krasilnikovia sp. MM14-A1259]|uniref:helix-hairpin-helix domain-containing protein n=1 Tax=Krasilnikovia sp. MM14-A1259 TaxID=3373539 RepID=UPI00399CAD83